LFYNLGNAYFKQGDYGRSILNYRRAERLAPRDPDIKANLVLARAQMVDQLEEPAYGKGLVSQMAQFSRRWLTLNELAIIPLILWFMVVCLIIAFRHSKMGSVMREGLQYALVVTSLALVLGIVGLGSRLYVEGQQPEGIIVADEINVTSGPGSQYVTEFTLHSGTEVTLIERRGNWVRLTLPGGDLQGWIPGNVVETIGGY